MDIGAGYGGVTNGLSSEQYEKLIFLLNNTKFQKQSCNYELFWIWSKSRSYTAYC